jgi:hypothetical protein
VYINQAALDLAPSSGIQRKLILGFVRSLANAPFTKGDFSERDDSGREVQVKVIGGYAVTYWSDHAVSEVKVTHIKPADR